MTVSQVWMLDTMGKSIAIAKSKKTPFPRCPFVYMDDVWGLMKYPRSGLRSSTSNPSNPAIDFQTVVNSIHPRVQFTVEEEENGSIAFLDAFVTREEDGSLSTCIFRKPSNTNVMTKPQSCQHPNTVNGILKAEICRAQCICSSPDQAKKEIDHTIDLLVDNGHKRAPLEKIAHNYVPSLPKKQNRKQGAISNSNVNHTDVDISMPENLFDVLPFADSDLSEEEPKPYIVMTYLPKGVYHQMKRACKKAGVQLITRPGTKLKDLYCVPNRTHHEPFKKPGIYKLQCSCSNASTYVGQTIRPIAIRGKEHQQAAQKGNWAHSGIAQHKEHCNADVDWKPEVIKNMSNKNKKRLTYNLKVREALEIRRNNCGPGSGLNEDFGAYVRTTQWNPVFHQMDNG